MNLFYEQDGDFHVGRVLSQAPSSWQVESIQGKRSKIKATQVLLQFDQALGEFLTQAKKTASGIDVAFLWENAPPAEEFDSLTIAQEYYGHKPSALEQAALLIRLHHAPMYFYKKGKGVYRAAPKESLESALKAAARREQETALKKQYIQDLIQFVFPPDWVKHGLRIAYQPDAFPLETKVLSKAMDITHLPLPLLLHRCGLISTPIQYRTHQFLYAYFPEKIPFDAWIATENGAKPPSSPSLDEGWGIASLPLPLAPGRAFSIDDEGTTEIDDAFSVQTLGAGYYRVGIHIAAPALGFAPDSPWDNFARERLSTVYMPGRKIRMLPEQVIQVFSLQERHISPCVSLYLDFYPATNTISVYASKIERIQVAANLWRGDLGDTLPPPGASYPGARDFGDELRVLWQLSQQLATLRQATTGGGDRPEYHFAVEWENESAGLGTVSITGRQRYTPIDTLVAELMIKANQTWGLLLAEDQSQGKNSANTGEDNGGELSRYPALYRIKPRGEGGTSKVRMSIYPGEHIGLGISHYAWCTSPLRRYVDLVNQWQLIACLRGESPPFPASIADEQLLSIIEDFEATTQAYQELQDDLEHAWARHWLVQEEYVGGTKTLLARTLKTYNRTENDRCRLVAVPVVCAVHDLPATVPPESAILVNIAVVDEWNGVVRAQYMGVAP